MRPWLRLITFFAVLFSGVAPATAGYPVVDAVAGLPHPELITVYPDDTDPDQFYFVPTSVELVFSNGKPRLGVQYWGLTGPDQNGAGAALTFSVRPAFDKAKVDDVAAGLKTIHPNAKFSFPALVSSKIDLILNSQFAPDNQDKTSPTSISGGTVDATAAFTAALNNVGARAFAQGVSPDSDVLGARYTYKFTGVAKRLHAKITIYWKRVYDHFHVSASHSGFFGWGSSDWNADWQKLIADGNIKLEYLQGGDTDGDAYMMDIFKTIVAAKVGGEGMFKPELQPGAPPSSNGSANFGYGFHTSASWEHLEETKNDVIEIDKKRLEDREFQVGLTFAAVCAAYPSSFVDLTSIGKQCLDANLYKQTVLAAQACLKVKQDRLNALFDAGKLTYDQWNSAGDKAGKAPCYTVTIASPSGGVGPALMRSPKSAASHAIQNLIDHHPDGVSESLINAVLARPK